MVKNPLLVFLIVMVPLMGCSPSSFVRKSDEAVLSKSENQSTKVVAEESSKWLDRTDIAVNVEDGQDASWSIETIQPIHQTQDSLRHTVFYQANLARRNGDDTANIGLGYRNLNLSETSIVGVNIFYDTTREAGHQRGGFGLEYLGKMASFRANIYRKLTGEKLIVDGTKSTYEQTLNGVDYSVEFPFPYAKTMRLNLTGYDWEGVRAADDLSGQKFSINGLLTDRIIFSIGVNDNNYDGSKAFASFTYQLGTPKSTSNKKVNGNGVFVERNLRNHTLDKVMRENDIIVQKRGGIVIGRSSS